ncbi:MAG: low molecular weight protein-tyrosine-phosphatase [Acidiferrobacteraceae bacterium]
MTKSGSGKDGHPVVRVLFVCLGNICRSPMAEGVFRHLVQQAGLEDRIRTDSAGTHAYHVGEPPDKRACAAVRGRGIDISDLRGRRATPADLATFDYVLAMDRENLANLQAIATPDVAGKIRLFMEYASDRKMDEVPDPYFGGAAGFEQVLHMIENAAAGLLADIRSRYRLDT